MLYNDRVGNKMLGVYVGIAQGWRLLLPFETTNKNGFNMAISNSSSDYISGDFFIYVDVDI